MLTATYSLVAISAEQDKTRSRLSRLQQYLHSSWKGLQVIDFSFLEAAVGKLQQFDSFFRMRKLELYLLPALRGVSRETEMLAAELDALSAKGMGILSNVGEKLADVIETSAVKVNEICHAIQSYCDCITIRIEKEERELIPLARRIFSIDDWFAIAAQFLAYDGRHGWWHDELLLPRTISASTQPIHIGR